MFEKLTYNIYIYVSFLRSEKFKSCFELNYLAKQNKQIDILKFEKNTSKNLV